MKHVLLAAFVLSTMTAPAFAVPCKDEKGRFAKCPKAASPIRCKNEKGKYAKCGMPGTHSVDK